MSADLTVTRGDARAGYSSFCRRLEHGTCEMAQARCSCFCHGPGGQTPPGTPPPSAARPGPSRPSAPLEVVPEPKEITVEEHETQTPPQPGGDVDCGVGDCERSFGSQQAASLHRRRAHPETVDQTEAPKDAAPAQRPAKAAAKRATKAAAKSAAAGTRGSPSSSTPPPPYRSPDGEPTLVVAGKVVDGEIEGVELGRFPSRETADLAVELFGAVGVPAQILEGLR